MPHSLPSSHRWRGRLLAGLLSILCTPASHAELPPQINGQPLPSLAPMLSNVVPAVVNISTKTRVRVQDPFFNDPIFRQFFGLPNLSQERVQQSLGSGVIVDAAHGYVLTNNHVVGGADDISVTLKDGRTLSAKLIGTDPDTDVAVIQIPAERLNALPIADSTRLQVGDFVVAVGDPFGLGQAATSGIVSALGRSGLGGSRYQNFIQTDASINPGNSGGALVNLRGELVGINTMIFTPSGGNVGIGFAIPSSLARNVMQQLITQGKVSRGNLGIDVQDLTPRLAQLLGLKSSSGVAVTAIDPDSPADRAELQPGDIIQTLDGKPLHNADELRNAEGLLPLGSKVQLEVSRNGASRTVTLALATTRLATLDGSRIDPRLGGVLFSELPAEQHSRQAGVAVSSVSPGSRAAQAGLKSGDLLVGMGNLRISSLRELGKLAGMRPPQWALVIADPQGAHYVVVQ